MKRETRNVSQPISIRANSGSTGADSRYIEGYAAVFNQPSKQLIEWHDGQLRQFVEIIRPGAFDSVLSSPELNVVHTVNHDRNQMVGRTVSRTLELAVDDTGLKYRVQIPNGVDYAENLYTLTARGDYFESSFVFTIDSTNELAEQWTESGDTLVRYINAVSGLFDVSTVTDGAYANTKVAARDLKQLPVEMVPYVDQIDTVELEQKEIEIFLIKTKSV